MLSTLEVGFTKGKKPRTSFFCYHMLHNNVYTVQLKAVRFIGWDVPHFYLDVEPMKEKHPMDNWHIYNGNVIAFTLIGRQIGDAFEDYLDLDFKDDALQYAIQGIYTNAKTDTILSNIIHLNTTGIDDSTLATISLFPNPVEHLMNTTFENDEMHLDKMTIYTIDGQLILSQRITPKKHMHIDVYF